MGSDAPVDRFTQPAGFAASVMVEDPDRAEGIFHPLSPRFGMLTDKFEIPWMVNCEQPK